MGFQIYIIENMKIIYDRKEDKLIITTVDDKVNIIEVTMIETALKSDTIDDKLKVLTYLNNKKKKRRVNFNDVFRIVYILYISWVLYYMVYISLNNCVNRQVHIESTYCNLVRESIYFFDGVSRYKND